VGRYGTDLTGFGAFEGGVNADKGAPLVSTSSDGETALLFGPAALREIQAGVANGDFAIPPDAAGDTITEENPLPYWTFTDTSSAGAITCSIVADATSGSGNKLRFSVAANTPSGKQARMTRFVPIFGTQNQAFSYAAELTSKCSVSSGTMTIAIQQDFFEIDQVTKVGSPTFIGTPFSTSLITVSTGILPVTTLAVPPSAAFVRLIIYVNTMSTSPGTVSTCDVFETRLLRGDQALFVAEQTAPATYAPALIEQKSGVLSITPDTSTSIAGSLGVTGDIGVDGFIYFDTDKTGAYIRKSGTNLRTIAALNADANSGADWVASTSSTRSGIMVTKSVTGQPTTNLNGTGAQDAFADVLRNGGIALDVTNNRAYFYSGGWKYAALTTPSDSRLKEEITEISGALDTLRQLMPVAFKWKRPEAHGRAEAVGDNGTRLGFIADQVATTDLKHWVETLGVDEREADLVDTTEVLAVNIPQNEMEALVVQALLDIDARLKALEER
jgi:hypothetical protein